MKNTLAYRLRNDPFDTTPDVLCVGHTNDQFFMKKEWMALWSQVDVQSHRISKFWPDQESWFYDPEG